MILDSGLLFWATCIAFGISRAALFRRCRNADHSNWPGHLKVITLQRAFLSVRQTLSAARTLSFGAENHISCWHKVNSSLPLRNFILQLQNPVRTRAGKNGWYRHLRKWTNGPGVAPTNCRIQCGSACFQRRTQRRRSGILSQIICVILLVDLTVLGVSQY